MEPEGQPLPHKPQRPLFPLDNTTWPVVEQSGHARARNVNLRPGATASGPFNRGTICWLQWRPEAPNLTPQHTHTTHRHTCWSSAPAENDQAGDHLAKLRGPTRASGDRKLERCQKMEIRGNPVPLRLHVARVALWTWGPGRALASNKQGNKALRAGWRPCGACRGPKHMPAHRITAARHNCCAAQQSENRMPIARLLPVSRARRASKGRLHRPPSPLRTPPPALPTLEPLWQCNDPRGTTSTLGAKVKALTSPRPPSIERHKPNAPETRQAVAMRGESLPTRMEAIASTLGVWRRGGPPPEDVDRRASHVAATHHAAFQRSRAGSLALALACAIGQQDTSLLSGLGSDDTLCFRLLQLASKSEAFATVFGRTNEWLGFRNSTLANIGRTRALKARICKSSSDFWGYGRNSADPPDRLRTSNIGFLAHTCAEQHRPEKDQSPLSWNSGRTWAHAVSPRAEVPTSRMREVTPLGILHPRSWAARGSTLQEALCFRLRCSQARLLCRSKIGILAAIAPNMIPVAQLRA